MGEHWRIRRGASDRAYQDADGLVADWRAICWAIWLAGGSTRSRLREMLGVDVSPYDLDIRAPDKGGLSDWDTPEIDDNAYLLLRERPAVNYALAQWFGDDIPDKTQAY